MLYRDLDYYSNNNSILTKSTIVLINLFTMKYVLLFKLRRKEEKTVQTLKTC